MIKFRSLLTKNKIIYKNLSPLYDRLLYYKMLNKGTFSQHKEDVEILRLLKKYNIKGIYIDVGSNHPFKISNTYLLYLNGFNGICIDPLPKFKKLYEKYRPNDIFECACVDERNLDLPFYEFESSVLSTLDKELADQYVIQGYRYLKEIKIVTKTLDSILESYKVKMPISIISIDVEGHELSVLKSINLDNYCPSYICLEAITADGNKNHEAISYLERNGYDIEVDLGLNLLFRRKAIRGNT